MRANKYEKWGKNSIRSRGNLQILGEEKISYNVVFFCQINSYGIINIEKHKTRL